MILKNRIKVGDIFIATKKANGHYSTTCEGWAGKLVGKYALFGDHQLKGTVDDDKFWVNLEYFRKATKKENEFYKKYKGLTKKQMELQIPKIVKLEKVISAWFEDKSSIFDNRTGVCISTKNLSAKNSYGTHSIGRILIFITPKGAVRCALGSGDSDGITPHVFDSGNICWGNMQKLYNKIISSIPLKLDLLVSFVIHFLENSWYEDGSDVDIKEFIEYERAG